MSRLITVPLLRFFYAGRQNGNQFVSFLDKQSWGGDK